MNVSRRKVIINIGLYKPGKNSKENVAGMFFIDDSQFILSIIRILSSKGEKPKKNVFE
jgi:hypothetical protein